MKSKTLFWISSISLTLLLTMTPGCQSEQPPAYPADAAAVPAAEPTLDESFMLGPGDVVFIKFFYESRLNDEVVIRPDGKISLQLIGQVKAAGLTPDELQSLLAAKYAKVMYPDCVSDSNETVSSYALATGSVVSVRFIRNSELNDDLIIRPDGKISLPLLGEIKAAGLTPSELETVLAERHAQVFPEENQLSAGNGSDDTEASGKKEVTVVVRDFKIPELTVSVASSSARRVYVTGEVRSPGFVSMAGGTLRVFDAVILTGGTLDTAELGKVILLRSNGTQTPDIYSVNLKQIAGGSAPNFALRPYDVVYVPKTFIANVGTFVQQHIHSIIPVQFNAFYNVHDSEVKVTD